MIESFGLQEVGLLIGSLRWTIGIAAIASVLGAIFGFLIAIARLGRVSAVRRLAAGYISTVQGIPVLILVFLSYYGLALFGINFPPLMAAAVSLGIFTSGYLADIWRGCIEAVPRQQWEASASLALRRSQQYRYVILPQALRLSIPPTVGFLVQLVKNTSVLSVVGIMELTRAGQLINNIVFRPFEVFGVVALLYFVICFPLSLISRALERKLNVNRNS